MNQENKITNEQRIAKSKAEKKARFAQNAKSADKYYGRRYLGTTKYGGITKQGLMRKKPPSRSWDPPQ